MKKDIPIGSEFEFRGNKYKVVKTCSTHIPCRECALWDDSNDCENSLFCCTADERADKTEAHAELIASKSE